MHIKIPQTHGPVMDALKNRWSPRSFAAQAISDHDLNTIIEGASWAFSAFNEQPWRYIVAHRGTALFDQLWSLLMPGNQPWCKDAAVLVLSMMQTKQAATGNPNGYAMHDLGAANFALMLQANALNIYGHVMAGFDKARSQTELELPEGIEAVAMIALGYLDVPEKLSEPFLERELMPRSRKSVEELILKRS